MLEKHEIIEVLEEWNYWTRSLPDFVLREDYMAKMQRYEKSGEIIVLTGVRRSGKTTLLKQEIGRLIKKYDKKQMLFVNFEDPRFSPFLNTDLLEAIFQTYKEKINPGKKIFLFLDEIQNIPEWEKWVRTKHELNQANIYVTGSSSKLLSKEFGTLLAGRYLQINVFPLSFKEFLLFNDIKLESDLDILSKKTKIKHILDQYIEYGGFPKISLLPEDTKREELQLYFEGILLRDIVSRYKLKNFLKLEQVTYYLLSNIAKFYSVNSIKNSVNVSYEVVLNYISYLREALFFYKLNKFDYSLKKQIFSKNKIYCIDSGLINAVGFKFSEQSGRLIENLVFVELKRRNKELYYFSEKKECDFVIKKGLRIVEAIQVCYKLNKDNEKREIKGLTEAMNKFKLKQGLILTYDQEDELRVDNKKIIIKPLWKWLLHYKD